MRTLRFLAVLAIGFVAFPALLLRAGTLKAIYTFGTAYPDAQTPHGALVFDKSGNLYGATTFGGENDLGTIFELSPDGNGGWNKAVLYDFCAMPNCADGSHANGGLIFDSQGNLYGTTMVGGKNGTGTVFKLSHDADKHAWQEDVLYSFRASRSGDGNYPKMGLVLDNRGNLYGTTWGGGSSNCGCGAVFELTPSNQQWTETVLYAFTAEGAGTTNPLIFNSDQTVLYGAGPGGVFQLAYKDGQWNESEVYSFGYDTNDIVGITRDTSNNLYGVLINGGSGQGLAFELTYQNGAWTENTIYTFSNNGAIYPSSPLLFDPTQTTSLALQPQAVPMTWAQFTN